ncbi:MAG: M4 family metallopeptidase [Phycisphaerae bacterium]|nr:M4 family metallopeptidase [Saprospiraceae bacterium]
MKQCQSILRLFTLSLGLFASGQMNAQTQTPTLLKTDNTFIQQRIENSDPEGWLFFKNSSDLKEGQLFGQQAAAAGLSANDGMLLIKTEADEQGNTHNRYQQYYKGIEVEGGEIFEHVRDCYVYLLHGKIIEGLNFNAQPVFTQAHALNNAKTFLGASQYAWENSDWEQGLKDDTGDPNATYYPTGSLILTYLPGTTLESGNYRLTWKFEILALTPSIHKTVFVDANSGIVIKSREMACDNGPAGTPYDGTQTIDTRWVGGLLHGHHHLETDDNEKNIQTKNQASGQGWGNLFHVFDNDDNWGTDPGTVATTGAHWAVCRSWDFFKNTYGRKGMDNNNAKVRVLGNSILFKNNAQWQSIQNADFITIGASDGTAFGLPAGVSWAALDIAGHEFTHGITNRTAKLVYAGESGALNESFSDIFGVMVERFARGGAFNWTHGEDRGFISRDMQTPAAGIIPQPSTFLTDPLWFSTVGCVPSSPAPPTGNDNCGVHVNSGVQNRWFFLLSQGGTQNGVSVQGIGIDKAARIAYVNLTTFIGSNANHPAARLGAISAAQQLYGVCSNEVIQTTNAWAAVGVGAPYSGTCLTISGERIICTDFTTFPYYYGATDLPGATFSWTYPTSWTGVSYGPGNKYLKITGLGNYNPPGGYPATAVIGVTSSLGGSTQISVKIHNGGVVCEGLCGHNGEERGSWKEDSKKESEKVAISPNPAIDKITILHPEKIVGLLNVYSHLGSKVLEVIPTGSSSEIDISKLANGTYFVAVNLGSETVTKRFVKAN